ncbi:MAG TPA: hypothetical protein VN231_05920 [Allosphingosinicella sp.]|nr:hypothetical protein [Allosphingosinicella sp.]
MTVDRSASLTARQRFHKVKARELVKRVGGLEDAADYCRLGKSQLSDCCNPNVVAFLPSDAVEDLEAVAGEPVMTRMQAREAGFGLVRLPDPGAAPTVWSGFIARLGREAGELIEGICTDLTDDNDVTPAEAGRRLADAADLVRVAVELEAALKTRAAARA